VIAAPKDADITKMADLAGKTVVTARGTTNDNNVTKMAPPGTNIVRFENDATAITAITSGQASIFSTAPSIVAALNKQGPSKPLETKIVMATAMLGIGVAKDNTALKEKVNELIRENLKGGELNTIFKKYHGTDLPQEVVAEGA
jgi:polar amino acid transport system substrate-binding protein